MTYINDKNLPYLVEKLSNADNIKINNNKHGSRVSTVINSLVTKSDNITKTLEQTIDNSSHNFKIGTGNVDVSTDVKDGFGEIVIKGVTYQNILGTPTTTTNGVGISNNTITFNKVAQTNCTTDFGNSIAQVNKTYTLIFDILENTIENPANGNIGKINIVSYNSGNYFIKYKETGHKKILLKQPATSTSKPYVEFYNSTSGKFVMTIPILLEGDHTNNSDLPIDYFDSFVHVGSTGKNLFNINDTIEGFIGGNNSILPPDCNNLLSNYIKVKPNTQYTYSIGGYDKPTNIDHWTGWTYYKNKYGTISTIVTDRQSRTGPDDSYKTMSFTTPSDCYYIRIGSRHLSLPNAWAQLERSRVATPYEPFTYKVEVSSCRKNLLNLNDLQLSLKANLSIEMLTSNSFKLITNSSNTDRWSSAMFDGFNFKENTTYRITAKCTKSDNTNTPFISVRKKNLATVFKDMYCDSNGYINGTFVANGISSRIEFFAGNNNGTLANTNVIFEDIMLIEEPANDLNYEPYQGDKTQILLDEPLMRLPNGICDEITEDGKLIRRVGKIVCTGEEPGWNYWPQFDSTNYISFHVDATRAFGLPAYPNIAFINTDVILSDKFPYEAVASANTISEGIMIRNASPNYIGIRIKKSRLANYSDSDTIDVKISKLREWLKNNSFTLYYQLLTPEVTQLNPISIRTFENGYIMFNTLVAPESTHKVKLNKSAQIESTNKEVNKLENRVTNLENFYDDVILETSYKLALLDYDFEYTKEREDE